MENVEHTLSAKALRDLELVKKAMKGNQKAFADLMGYYRESLYFMILKMINNREDADDLTLEAFGKAFKRLETYTPNFAFSTWLFKIATNNCIDFIRRNKRMRPFSIDRPMKNAEGDDIQIEIKSDALDPSEDFVKKQQVRLMHDVVDKLKPRYKVLVEMHYFRELSYEEIAKETELPLGTVKAQLFRARDMLSQILKRAPESE